MYKNSKKTIENKYALVHFDGPHKVADIITEIDFFMDKMSIGGMFIFDDAYVGYYDHDKIDDHLLNQMSRGIIQSELDKIKKPIKMGTVYVTSNGGENSKVQPKVVYHATVAGESRLVNEADIKSSIRKSLHLANEYKARNVVMLPPDCGTHDIFDTARVHLSAVKTYLQAEKNCNLKNIFIVMSDQESFDVYEEYYKRIFK